MSVDASRRRQRPLNGSATVGRDAARPRVNGNGGHRPVLITGGAGFIGTNLADRLLREGTPVVMYDNLSRPGVDRNLAWLRSEHDGLVQFEHADVRNREALRKAAQGVSHVFHLAAQVAVTTSLEDPQDDFDINAQGTLNVLEAVRSLSHPPAVIYTSTNKVYGQLGDVRLEAGRTRYEPVDPALREHGIDEDRCLHFHSPYGCSKGAAEQYVLDYAATFGLRTAVFRLSCIYGPHQFGNEDQGWVAHFLIRALARQSLTIYGDGRQVRDILFVDDLVEAFLIARDNISRLAGHVFNIGGGPANTVSLLELLELIQELQGKSARVRFDSWRPADQQYYVSDTRRFSKATGWRSTVGVKEGVLRLSNWLMDAPPAATSVRAKSQRDTVQRLRPPGAAWARSGRRSLRQPVGVEQSEPLAKAI